MMQAKNNISVLGTLRQSLKFNAVNLFSKIMNIPKTIIVALVLAPEEYGIIGLVGLWGMYASLISPGMDSGAYREMAHLLGKGKKKKVLHLQNVAISGKFLYTLFPFLVMLGASFFYYEGMIRICLILTAISYILTINTNYWSQFNRVRQRFSEVATGNFIKAITIPLVTVALIFWLKIYAVLIAPIIGAVFAFIYYIRKAGIDARFEWDWNELVRLIKIGFPMALLGLVYWVYRMADRTMIAAFLPLHELGLYYYAVGMVSFAILGFADFTKVLEPIVWTNLGKAKTLIEGFKPLHRIAVYMSIVAAISIGICQIGFYLLVNLVTTKYIESIPVFNVLAFGIFFLSMTSLPSIILTSSVVNKQTFNTKIWSIGLVLNIILDYIVIKMGYGIVGVSLVTVGIQGLVTLTLFSAVRQYMFYDTKEFTRFMRSILFPLSTSFLLYLTSISLKSRIQNIFLYGACSLILFAIIWIIVIRVFYPDYFQKEKIIKVGRKVFYLLKK